MFPLLWKLQFRGRIDKVPVTGQKSKMVTSSYATTCVILTVDYFNDTNIRVNGQEMV